MSRLAEAKTLTPALSLGAHVGEGDRLISRMVCGTRLGEGLLV